MQGVNLIKNQRQSSGPKLRHSEMNMDDKSEIIEMTADIVSAYVGNNSVSANDLPSLIQSVHRALSGVSAGVETVEVAPKEPAVPVKRSITPDYLICL
jgi:predicted transcriptional regulator